MDQESRTYYEQRARVERAAAKGAPNAQARRAHQALAQNYVALVEGRLTTLSRLDDEPMVSRLTVIGG